MSIGFLAYQRQERRLVGNSTSLPDWYLPAHFRLTSVAWLTPVAGDWGSSDESRLV